MLIMPRIRMHDRRVSIGKWGGKPSFWPSITTNYRWIWHFGNIKSAKTPRQYILINAEMQRCRGKLEIWICVCFVGNNKEMFERGWHNKCLPILSYYAAIIKYLNVWVGCCNKCLLKLSYYALTHSSSFPSSSEYIMVWTKFWPVA